MKFVVNSIQVKMQRNFVTLALHEQLTYAGIVYHLCCFVSSKIGKKKKVFIFTDADFRDNRVLSVALSDSYLQTDDSI